MKTPFSGTRTDPPRGQLDAFCLVSMVLDLLDDTKALGSLADAPTRQPRRTGLGVIRSGGRIDYAA